MTFSNADKNLLCQNIRNLFQKHGWNIVSYNKGNLDAYRSLEEEITAMIQGFSDNQQSGKDERDDPSTFHIGDYVSFLDEHGTPTVSYVVNDNVPMPEKSPGFIAIQGFSGGYVRHISECEKVVMIHARR